MAGDLRVLRFKVYCDRARLQVVNSGCWVVGFFSRNPGGLYRST